MKLRVVSRKIYDYVRKDLKEIAFPSSLPDPPHIKKRQKLTWKERYLVSYLNHDSLLALLFQIIVVVQLIFRLIYWNKILFDCINKMKPTIFIDTCICGDAKVLKEASRLYAASWVRDIGPELRPNEYKQKAENENNLNGEKGMSKEKEPSTLEDLAVAARGGMETLRPALQRVYMTRASAYRDALKSFIEGYQEGIQQVMEKKEDSKNQQEPHPPKG
ncbi:uncharacterized protein LOC121742502 isoform X1 [Salvia splendens]|nr:uncharacterized protein LOC121742502 isoform X1 [Salvia splendens]